MTSRAHIDKFKIQFVPHLIIGIVGDTDAARLGQHLQAGRDIYTVAIDVAIIDNDIAQVDADTKNNALALGLRKVALLDGFLNFNGVTYRFHNRGIFDQQAVAHCLDHAPVALLQGGIDNFRANGLQIGQRRLFIVLHQPAIADHIRGQNSGEFPHCDFFRHWVPQ